MLTINTRKERGPLIHENGATCIGRVGAPERFEATSEEFYFWVPPDALVEKTQLITCKSRIAGRDFSFYAIIDEVHRSSRKRSMGSEMDEADGDLAYEPPFESEGCTWASASILRTDPPLFTPPRERSEVLLATAPDAEFAYFADEIDDDKKLGVGLVNNGGAAVLGPGYIDLDYLLGANGGHMNVNGSAGRGTKSSFLMWINWLLLNKAREEKKARPSSKERLRVVPIILNVKGYDLFHIDRPSTRFKPQHAQTWQAMGYDEPHSFSNVTYLAAQQNRGELSVATGRRDTQPFSWSLKEIIEGGLLQYLFADIDANDANFGALVLDIENHFTDEKVHGDGSSERRLRSGVDGMLRDNFKNLLEWIHDQATMQENERVLKTHHTGTWKKLHRRLSKMLYDGKGVLRFEDETGHPLDVRRADTSDPIVVDLNALAATPEMQRFVVATILRQLMDARTGTQRIEGLVYLVTLDELNRFAPRGAKDPITKLIELVAAEMRSQGVILLGAQQQASKVSEKVIENSAIRVLGKSGSLELSQSVWGFLSSAARRKAEVLALDEKLVVQDNFREPMHVRVPFPVWAMNPNEAGSTPASLNGASSNGLAPKLVDDYSDIIDD